MDKLIKILESYGAIYQDGKLYLFHTDIGPNGALEILKFEPGNPRAWIMRIGVDANFRSCRPLIDLQGLDISIERRICEIEAGHDNDMRPLLDIMEIFDLSPDNLIKVAANYSKTNYYKRDPYESPGHKAWRHALRGVPFGVVRRTKYWAKEYQGDVLNAHMRVPALQELSNFGLLFLHSTLHRNPEHRTSHPFRTLRRLLKKPRRCQAAFYGLPATEQVVRILKDLYCFDIDLKLFLDFCKVIGKGEPETLKLLSHASRIDEKVMKLLTDPLCRNLCEWAFIRELTLQGEHLRHRNVERLQDTFTLAVHLDAQMEQIRSVKHLDRYFEELTEEDFRRNPERYELSAPPISGVKGFIRHLGTKIDVVAHGRQMNNCIEQLIPKVLSGDKCLYEYRLEVDGKMDIGTLELKRKGTGWTLGEVSSFANETPSEETMEKIQDWISYAKELYFIDIS